jgi:hypothetical protein
MAAAEVASGAAGGMAAGSALGPIGTAVGGVIGGFGGLLAGNAAAKEARRAAAVAAAQQAEARKALAAGRGNAVAAYDPYAKFGTDATAMYGEALAGGANAPSFDYKQGEFSYDQYKDPGTQFRMDQANKAIQASAIAKGGVGGGLARALQTNSQGMASQEYANSFGRFQDTSKMLYGQAADQWNRDNTTQKQYLDRLQDAQSQGQQGQLAQSALLKDYDSGTASAWMGQASQGIVQANYGNEAQSQGYSAFGNALGNAAGTGISSWLGRVKGSSNPAEPAAKRSWMGTP